jgi:paraquat-inducible protein B
MGNKATFLRVGLLVVFGIAAVVFVVLFLGRNQVRDGQRYETYFRESVQGLDIGAPVKYRGVTLGQVTEITLVSSVYPESMPADNARLSYQLVMVRYLVDTRKLGAVPDLEQAVREGLRARLASQGLTGIAYLEIDFVDPQKYPVREVPWKPATFYVPSMPSTVAQVQDAVTSVLERLNKIDYAAMAASLQTVLNDAHAQLTTGEVHAVLADTAAITHSLRTTLEQAHLAETASDLRDTVVALKQVAQSKDTQAMIAKAAAAADQLADAAKKLPALLAAVQAGVRHTDEGVADVTGMLVPVLRDARAAVANLRDTSEALRRYPAATLLGGPPPHEKEGR